MKRRTTIGAIGRSTLLVSGLLAIMSPAQPAMAGNMAFDLNITLSAKAAAKLKAHGEGITVLASYYGDPTPAAEQHANDIGTIDLATETIELPGAPAPAHVSGRHIPAQRLGWIKGPVKVNVNVYSSRKASEDNILNCDFIDTEVSKVAGAPVTLECSLIGEGLETLSRP